MNKYFKYTMVAAAAALACACTKNEAAGSLAGHEMVPVQITLDSEDVHGALTRSGSPLFPEMENWIFDYYYCQYDRDGVSVTSGHRRTDVTMGDLSVKDQIWLWDLEGGSIYFIANIVPADSPYNDDPGWQAGNVIKIADNTATLKTMKFDMTQRIAAAERGDLRHMPMCGYWEGDITPAVNTEGDPFHMTATLGRMIVRMNIHVTNKSGKTVTGVTLSNVSTKAYIYPQVVNAPLDDTDYTSFTNDLSIANNGSASIYFYTAPNYCEKNGNVTTLTFTHADGTTASLEVGNDVAVSDYNLYMNTIYTYTITLK